MHVLRRSVEGMIHMQHILRRIVMHVAQFADVVIRACHFEFIVTQDFRRLSARPGEVISIIIERHVGILRAVEAALLMVVSQPSIHAMISRTTVLKTGYESLACMDIVPQQPGIVVQHLFEMRHHPALIDGIAMEAAAQLVVDAALRHLRQRHRRHFARLQSPLRAAASSSRSSAAGCGNFGCAPKPPWCGSNWLMAALHQLVDDRQDSEPPRRENVSPCSIAAIIEFRRLHHLVALRLPGIGHGEQ